MANAVAALPSDTELQQLPKTELISNLKQLVVKLSAAKAKTRKVLAAAKEPAFSLATQAVDTGVAAASGAGVGYWMGAIQRKIAAGEEGYDEESLLILGIDLDLATGVAMGLGAWGLSTFSKSETTKRGAHYLGMASIGAISAATGRLAYESALRGDQEEDEAQAA